MRLAKLGLLGSVAVSLSLVACSSPSSDGADDTSQDVTGGSAEYGASPVAFIFAENASADDAPTCAGAMLSTTMVVTAKSCAKEGLVVGRAADNDGRGTQANVKAVHLADDPDAPIAILELDAPLKGAYAVITHTPLRDGYSINSFAATDGKGWLAPGKNEAATATGTVSNETSTYSSITADQGQEICDGDIGAPVCSSVVGKILDITLPGGTCGLSGLITERVDPTAKVTGTTAGCSTSPYKMVRLGEYESFITQYAANSFQPLVIDLSILGKYPYAPDGLWGYKTKGDITACTLGATALSALKPGATTAKLTAKVSFANMDEKAAPYGRFGIAPKSDPTNFVWTGAAPVDATTGTQFDAAYSGAVSAAVDGDYIIAFRASANGGETWTQCDTDGIANGFSADKALTLTVTDATPSSTPTPAPTTTSSSAPQASAPSDPPASSGEEATNDDGSTYSTGTASGPSVATTGKTSSSGCSTSGTSSPAGTSLPLIGVVLGLLALKRRRQT